MCVSGCVLVSGPGDSSFRSVPCLSIYSIRVYLPHDPEKDIVVKKKNKKNKPSLGHLMSIRQIYHGVSETKIAYFCYLYSNTSL